MVVLNENEITQIRELLSDGFDIKLIAMELDIPTSQLQELIEKEREKENVSVADDLEKKEKAITTNNIVPVENKNTIKRYKELIQKYKRDIIERPQDAQEKRNLLAFAYFKAGLLDEAREELMALIEENSSCMAYRQLIHIEKEEGNLEDAKLWAYEALEKYPDNIQIRNQLVSIAKIEQDEKEVIEQLKNIVDIRKREQERLQLIIEMNRGKLQRKIKGQER